MSTSRRGRPALWLLLAVLLPLVVACSMLPDQGAVHRRTATRGAGQAQQVPYFDPPGPARGASQEQIVKGFVTAMQAIPLNPAAARSFLSDRARSVWQPNGGTIVYQASNVQRTRHGVGLRLSDAHRLDSRGGWRAGPTHNQTLHLRLVREKGQWRIDNPVDALIVSAETFQSQFTPFNLYFYDRNGRVLVPDPVYVPRGEETATNLVHGLLAGPDPRLAPAVRNAFPTGTNLDLSVVVTDNGIADVPLSNQVLKLSPDEVGRAIIQLARTLRAVPGIHRVRMTVGGQTLAMPDGRTSVSVDEGVEFEPTGVGASHQVIGIRNGRVVTLGHGVGQPIAGPLGRHGYALRSLALDRSGGRVAAVAADGSTVFVSSQTPRQETHRVFEHGNNLLRPMYDLYGRLWLVDRTPNGAVVHVLRGRRDRVVRFPGISGQDVDAFSVSPDGSRLAVSLTGGSRPRVEVATILRGQGGTVLHGLQPRPIPVASYTQDDPGPSVDVGWRSATQVAVLTHPRSGLSQVVYTMADGSPGGSEPIAPEPFNGSARELVVNADGRLPLMLVDSTGRLDRIDEAGKWQSMGVAHVAAAAYAN
ncbi:MAG: LpqB family beta-propeller domain-containing protein [Marmoricola sp.]